jgi:uncharacterized protein (TIGR03437 family)
MKLLLAILCATALHAANLLTATPSSVALTCNTVTGPGTPATIVIKPAATLTSGSLAVTQLALSSGLVVTPPAPATLNAANQGQGLTYTVNLPPGCAGAATGNNTIRFYVAGAADVSVALNTTVIATSTPLVASPVALTCAKTAGAYTAGPAQTVSVTSAAAGGTPFSIDTSSLPSWLTIAPATGGVAGATGVAFTVSAVAPCGNYAPGTSNAVSIHLRDTPAPDGLIAVTLRILGPSPLVASPAAPLLSYTKGSGTPAFVDVALSASGSPAFAVDTTTLPPWLSVDAAKGTPPKTLRFTTTAIADSIAPGSYSATVHLQVTGFGDLMVPFGLSLANPAPKLTIVEGSRRDFSWVIGQPLPIPYITLESSDAAIPYSLVTGGSLAPIVGSSFLKGFAYSYGTPIPITFDPNIFAAAQAGTVLTGTVTIAWGSPAATTVVTLNVTVQPTKATLLGVSPLSLPTAAPGQTFTVALSGLGFVANSDPAQRTVVGIVSGGSLAGNANISATVLNASNIILTIAVPSVPDPLLPFAPTGSGGTIQLGVCNPAGTACAAPTGTATLSIVGVPVIQAVSSAASYLQVSPPALATVAPYDMVSLFGINFCTAGGAACGDGILYGTLDPAALRYPLVLSPDASGSARRLLTVTFQTHATPSVVVANAPLLFATNNQINLVVPAGVAAFVGKTIDIVVSFGAGTAVAGSAPFPVNVAAADPGLFAIGADGQGEGAVLALDSTMITEGNEGGLRQNPQDSDTVQIFLTGLGVPDSQSDNAATGNSLWPGDCVSSASYLASLNHLTSASATNVDGALISGGLLNTGRLAPCLQSSASIPTVSIGGQAALVTYAGWVEDSLAGLYQVNARLPGSAGPFTTASGDLVSGPLTAAVELPLVVTARGRASQPGVTMWVAPRLKVIAASNGSQVVATEGTAPYRYQVTAGSLPAGVTLNPATGAISGTPAANQTGLYRVTVTATDSSAIPLTGSVIITLTH